MESAQTTCKNCGHTFAGRYCNNCGEKVYTIHDKSIAHIFEEVFHFVTHFDGTLFTTLRAIFSSPGKLSTDYCNGIRKRYFKPLSLFLLLVVIYLLFPAFEGLNMRLNYHLDHPLYGGYALHKVQNLLAQKHFTEEQLAEIYHQKSEKISKFMLLVIIPLTALYCYIFTFKKRRLFFDQMVFASEASSVFLLWAFLVLPIITTLFSMLYRVFAHHYPALTDNILGLFIFIIFGAYISIAARKFYFLKKGQALLFTILFLVGFYLIVNWLYKFLLFATVINLIH